MVNQVLEGEVRLVGWEVVQTSLGFGLDPVGDKVD